MILRLLLRFVSADQQIGNNPLLPAIRFMAAMGTANPLMKLPSYSPPSDIRTRILNIAASHVPIDAKDPARYQFKSNEEKFKVFTACAVEFDHPVLNSHIHELADIESLIEYYQTSVQSADALERLTEQFEGVLPANLCIQTAPIRFDPTDKSFFKRSAFPGRPTIVSGLSASKKYKGYRADPVRRVRVEYEDRA